MITSFIIFVVICVLAVAAIGSVFAIIGGVLSLGFAPVAGIMGLFFGIGGVLLRLLVLAAAVYGAAKLIQSLGMRRQNH